MKKHATGNVPEPTRKELHNHCEEMEIEVERLKAENSRLLIDLENQKVSSLFQFRKSLLSFIEVADAMERLINHAENQADTQGNPQIIVWIGNLKAVFKLMMNQLQRHGVELMSIEKGDLADPERHMVVETASDPDRADEEIVEVIKRGYWWRGSLLRAAEVKAVLNKQPGQTEIKPEA